MQDLSIVVMSDLPAEEVELIEDPDEVHKIYRQSFIDEQVHLSAVKTVCWNAEPKYGDFEYDVVQHVLVLHLLNTWVPIFS